MINLKNLWGSTGQSNESEQEPAPQPKTTEAAPPTTSPPAEEELLAAAFDAEFGPPDPEALPNTVPAVLVGSTFEQVTTMENAVTDPAPTEAALSLESDELEEWVEPLTTPAALEARPQDSLLSLPDGRSLQLQELVDAQPELNIYRASPLPTPANTPAADTLATPAASLATTEPAMASADLSSIPQPLQQEVPQEAWPIGQVDIEQVDIEQVDNAPATLRVREAVGTAAMRLAQEATARRATGSPMIPLPDADFIQDDRQYLIDAMPVSTDTLAGLLATDFALPDVLHVLAQVAAALGRCHSAGWALLVLRPESILLGKPIQLTDFSFVAPVGSALPRPISIAGYSAPELAHPTAVDPRADVYAVGALLYRAVMGTPVPETGADLDLHVPSRVVEGIPQLLHRCLGPLESRFVTVDELHRELVRLKNRLRPTLSYAIGAASTLGLEPQRTTNQDTFGYLSGKIQSENGPVAWATVCVADGMGGMAGGEIASSVAVQTLLTQAALDCTTRPVGSLSPNEQADRLKDWVQSANGTVCTALRERGMRGGCTLVAVFVVGTRLTIAHIGDCRIYLLRDDTWQLLSRDHSFVMSLVLQGNITMDDIRTHPDRNKVTRSMGDRHPLPDYFIDSLETATGALTLDLLPGDVLLLGCDGLWEPILENEMVDAVGKNPDNLHAAAADLLHLVLERGASDNATVALLRVDQLDLYDRYLQQPAPANSAEDNAPPVPDPPGAPTIGSPVVSPQG